MSSYKTRQRELILEVLIQNKQHHIIADDVFENLRKNGNNVGKSTVYRYLDKLVSEGRVRKFTVGEGSSACYQYLDSPQDCTNHYHLKCTKCKKLIHVECSQLEGISSHILKSHNFAVDTSKTVLYGICGNCSGSFENK